VADPILIWGAGAIGGTLGAYWARAGHDVLLVDKEADHVAAMNRDGLSIEGPVEEFRQPVRAVTPDRVEGTCRNAGLREAIAVAITRPRTPRDAVERIRAGPGALSGDAPRRFGRPSPLRLFARAHGHRAREPFRRSPAPSRHAHRGCRE
jgi:hypothetical protein